MIFTNNGSWVSEESFRPSVACGWRSKAGGSLGTSGSVSWMFERRGLLEVEKKGAEDEGLMEAALEAGAEDVEEEDEARDGKHIGEALGWWC